MEDLKARIEEYTAERATFQALETKLFEEIKAAFQPEFETIQKRLPT